MSTTSLPDLTIPNGSSTSNALSWRYLRHLWSLAIFSPETLDAHTFIVEVSAVDGASAAAADWRTLQEGGIDVQLSADKALVIGGPAFRGVRIRDTSGNVAADRTFKVVANDFA